MKLLKYIVLTLIVIATMISIFLALNLDLTSKPSLKSWLQGDKCLSFCWQQIDDTLTSNELVSYLENENIGYTVSDFETHYQWHEEQSLAPNGLGQTSGIFSENGQIIRVIADMRACITTILDSYGNPDDIRSSDGHFSMIYFNSNSGEGWTFSFRDETLPYAEVVMRILNDDNFSLNMEQITFDELSAMISEPCNDAFNS